MGVMADGQWPALIARPGWVVGGASVLRGLDGWRASSPWSSPTSRISCNRYLPTTCFISGKDGNRICQLSSLCIMLNIISKSNIHRTKRRLHFHNPSSVL